MCSSTSSGKLSMLVVVSLSDIWTSSTSIASSSAHPFLLGIAPSSIAAQYLYPHLQNPTILFSWHDLQPSFLNPTILQYCQLVSLSVPCRTQFTVSSF